MRILDGISATGISLASMESGVGISALIAELVLADTDYVIASHTFLNHKFALRTPAEM